MKKNILFILLFLWSSIFSQTNRIPIIGKWKEVEYRGKDGANSHTSKIKNGRIFIFKNNDIVTDSIGTVGQFHLKGDSLQIIFAKRNLYYRLDYNYNYPTKLGFTAVDSEYKYYCDEGCLEIFTKIGIEKRKIKGTAVQSNQDPIPFAKIKIKETKNETVANAEGKFEIEAKEFETLIISYPGFHNKEIIVTDQDNYTANLDNSEIIVGRKYKRRIKREIKKKGFYIFPD